MKKIYKYLYIALAINLFIGKIYSLNCHQLKTIGTYIHGGNLIRINTIPLIKYDPIKEIETLFFEKGSYISINNIIFHLWKCRYKLRNVHSAAEAKSFLYYYVNHIEKSVVVL